MLDSVKMASGTPPNSSVFSSTLSTFSLLQFASAAGSTLIPFLFRFSSTALNISIPLSGRESIEFDDRSAKSRRVS